MNESDMRDEQFRRQYDPTGVKGEAWTQTVEDMRAIKADREDDGWEVWTAKAPQTDTVSKQMGDTDRFGLTHVVPNNYADVFTEVYDEDAFTEYLVYGSDVERFRYAVIEFLDPETERSILLACRYDLGFAEGMVKSANEEGILYSHMKTIDGTILATFAHEAFEPLVSPPTSGFR